MGSKTLTISIAAYNAEACLEQALQSCLISNHSCDLEVLVVNDGSNDRTSFLAHEFARRYPDVFRVIDKDNGGYGSTVNRAIREARGTYFKLLDADDQYDTDNLEIFIEELQKTDADMVLTDYVECRKDEQRKVSYPFPKETLLDPKALDCDLGMHAICF